MKVLKIWGKRGEELIYTRDIKINLIFLQNSFKIFPLKRRRKRLKFLGEELFVTDSFEEEKILKR